MPGIGDQQVLQQLLTGMNTMQMQSGLMPGGVPALNNQNTYRPQPVATPAQFSNDLAINLRNTFSYQPLTPPMFGGITPVPRTQEAQGYLPGPVMGGGWGMARQQAQGNASKFLTSAQTTTGFGARAAFGTGVGLLATPFVGPWGGAAIGAGADYLLGDTVERMAQMPFKPMIDQQQRAMQLQNMSMNNVRRGSDLSASGMGLSLTASMDLERNLMRTADNRNFKRDTGGMFNRQDMMKLTEISSQVGLLDNAQSVDQISRDMGKIGRALSTFMKVVEEPDVRKALQMLGQMRNLGMNIPETNVAAANARTYARMAGTTVQGVMQAGMQGAGMFQQYGMSAATGLNVGMAATGIAGTMGTALDPRTLNMLGGREGIAASLASSTAQMSQIGAILPGLLARGKDGKLGVDEKALNNLMTGRGSIQDLVRQSSARMSGKQGADFITEYSTRKSELQDQLMNSMGGMGGVLLPLILARRTVESGATKDMGAALRIAGLDEKQARTYQLLSESGTLGDTLRQQQRTMQLERQKVRAQRREGLSEAASGDRWSQFGANTLDATYNVAGFLNRSTVTLGAMAFGADVDTSARGVRRGLRGIGNAAERFQRENFGEDTDIEEQQIAAGGGRLLRSLRPGEVTDSTAGARLAERLGTDAGASKFLKNWATGAKAGPDRVNKEIERYVSQRQRMLSGNPLTEMGGLAERMFTGPGGTGATELGRGGESAAETILANRPLSARVMNSTAMQFMLPALTERETTTAIRQRGNDQVRVGRDIETALSSADGSGIRAIGAKYKLSPEATATATSQAAVAVRKYFKDKQSSIGPYAWQSKDITGETLDKAIEGAIASTPNLTPEQKKRLAADLRTEAIRSASQGMTSTEKDFVQKWASGAADTASQLGSGATQQTLMADAEKVRKDALGQMGIGTRWQDDLPSASKAVAVFSKEGKEGELQQKYLIAKSLDAAANASGDSKAADTMRMQAAKLRADIENDEGATAAQRAGAREGAGSAAEKMHKDQLQGMGTAFSREINKGHLEKSLTDIRKKLQGAAGQLDFSAAAVGELGVEGTKIFQEGAKTGKGVASLREYYSGKGDKAGLKSLEGMTDEQMARKISKRIGRNAEGKFAGGLSQLAEGTAQDVMTTETINKIEEDARKDKERGAGSEQFGEVVSSFAKATTEYATGAREFREAIENGDLAHIVRKGSN